MIANVAIAVNRFGLGARPDEAMPADPKRWLLDQMAAFEPRPAVLTATEFGRTAAVNGTGGTDHGTGGAAFLAGGAVAGGWVVADWPGLSGSALYENRDLRPTTDLRAVMLGAAAGSFGVDPARLSAALFAGAGVRPVEGLVRT